MTTARPGDVRGGSYAHRTPVQTAALAVAATFLLVGILGFIPGITKDVGGITFLGDGSDAHLLGIFHVSILHNIVHLLFGAAGLALARTFKGAKNFLIVGGAIYLVLFLYGLAVANKDTSANFVPLNTADNWLHLVLAIGMIALGVLLGRDAVHSGTGALNSPGPTGGSRPRQG
ncbi:DUF4383 domain-containing protein [Mycobacterium sp. MYCO198283]|uniref:DUF4383 domain-containing protein n=1 Tax=Mycobacterium sp. MYCO198283 TaxID=2883505 RepID=UPI001E499D8A|nr:DUF4383 domain-containing protein [Mycobacterium sp. MYCO198283]MCG5433156.1 DUF4383 domain-containing protein [Mycobacterium sp. MYCO198283]